MRSSAVGLHGICHPGWHRLVGRKRRSAVMKGTQVARVPVDIPDTLVSALAEAVAERVVSRLERDWSHQPDGWLTSHEAADYLGLSLDALHKLTSARTVPFSQDAPGAKLWFLRSDLDAWRLSKRRGWRPNGS